MRLRAKGLKKSFCPLNNKRIAISPASWPRSVSQQKQRLKNIFNSLISLVGKHRPPILAPYIRNVALQMLRESGVIQLWSPIPGPCQTQSSIGGLCLRAGTGQLGYLCAKTLPEGGCQEGPSHLQAVSNWKVSTIVALHFVLDWDILMFTIFYVLHWNHLNKDQKNVHYSCKHHCLK